MIAKLAVLAVRPVKGGPIVVATDDAKTLPIREMALAAQVAGAVTVGGKQVKITGGIIIHTWANPSIVFRFRCEPAGKSGATEA
jgi:hypothetical protein